MFFLLKKIFGGHCVLTILKIMIALKVMTEKLNKLGNDYSHYHCHDHSPDGK